MRIKNDRKLCDTGLKTYVLFILLFPTFWGYLGASRISLGQIGYIIAVLSFGLILLVINRKLLRFPSVYTAGFLSLALCFAASISYNSVVNDGSISFIDFSDLMRPFTCLLSVCIGFSLYSNNNKTSEFFHFLILSILLCSIFDIIKFFDAGQYVMKLYTHLGRNTFNYMRFSGTFAYCYNYCYILLFGLLLSMAFHKRHYYTVLFLILIALTGSRAGVIAVVFAFICLKWIENGVISAFKAFVTLLIGVVILVTLLMALDIPLVNEIIGNVEKLISALSGEGSDGSLSTRNSQLNAVIENFKLSPVFGRGPLKSSRSPIEIQLGYYLSSWGLLGTICFLCIIIMALYCALRCMHGKGIVDNFSKANFVWILCSFIMGMSTPITDQIRVSQFFYLIQGIQYSIFLAKYRVYPFRRNNKNMIYDL